MAVLEFRNNLAGYLSEVQSTELVEQHSESLNIGVQTLNTLSSEFMLCLFALDWLVCHQGRL